MKKTIGILCCVAILSSSCQRIYYAPNQPSIPYLKERNDYEIRSINGGAVNDIKTWDIQAAYSPWKYVALTFNTALYANGNRAGAFLVEGGGGLYYPVSSWLHLGLYGGYGGGKIVYRFTRLESDLVLRFERSYVLPCLHVGYKYVYLYGGVRYAWMKYKEPDVPAGLYKENLEEVDFIRARTPFALIEPTIGIRIGKGAVYVHVQYTDVQPTMRVNGRIISAETVAMGLSVNQDLFRSKKEQPENSAPKW